MNKSIELVLGLVSIAGLMIGTSMVAGAVAHGNNSEASWAVWIAWAAGGLIWLPELTKKVKK